MQGEVTQADDIAGAVRQRIAAAGGDVDYVEVGPTRHHDSVADAAWSCAARLACMAHANCDVKCMTGWWPSCGHGSLYGYTHAAG